VRWLLLKDLRILGRSPLLVALLVLYPIVIATLIGFAISRGPDKPRVAFYNGVPASANVIELGGERIDLSKQSQGLFRAIDPVRVKSRREAIQKVRDGDVLGALVIPANIATKLQTGLQPGTVEVYYNAEDPAKKQFVENTIRSQVQIANAALTKRIADESLRLLSLIRDGGQYSFLGRDFQVLGLKRSEQILRKAALDLPRGGSVGGQVQSVIGFARLARDNLAFSNDVLDVVGPLGRPFNDPGDLSTCLLVGGGYGAAPLYFLAEELRAKDKAVHMIVGARTAERVFKPLEGKRLASSLVFTTDDGTMGELGRVTDALPSVIERTGAQVVYACGPNPMLRAVGEYCRDLEIPCQVAVEELMACGLGICWTCVVPFIALDGRGWWNVRACVEGPVLNAARIWWDRWLGASADDQTPPEGFTAAPEPQLAKPWPR
jgi:NAD(P)H-flavin reductase